MKRLLAAVLVLLLITGLLPVSLAAENDSVTITVNVDTELVSYIRIRVNSVNNDFTESGTLTVPVGSTARISYSKQSGAEIKGIYINGVFQTSSTSISSYVFNEDSTVEVYAKGPDELIELAYDSTAVSLQTRSEYPWTNTNGVLASGNQGTSAASMLAVTALQSGLLTFQYKTSTNEVTGWLLYKKGTELTRSNYTSADNYETMNTFGGEVDWTYLQIEMTEGDVIYFLHYKTSSNEGNETVWLKDFSFASDEGYAVTAFSSDSTYGSANVSEDFAGSGDEVTFTASPLNDGKFYGWVQDGQFVSGSASYTVAVYSDISLMAVFGAKGTYEARVEGIFYNTLAEAFEAGDTVVMTDDVTISSDLTIPNGSTFVIPYSIENARVDLGDPNSMDTRIYSNSSPYGKTYKLTLPSDEANRMYKLTVTSDTTVNVGGLLVLGGQYSGNATDHDEKGVTGQPYGKYSLIELQQGAQLNIDGGIFSCTGYVVGEGEINVINNGSVYENYVVTDFHGGTHMMSDISSKNFPFGSYVLLNIQAATIIDPTALVYGYCDAPYGGTSWGHTAVRIVGASEALIRLTSGTATMTYEPGGYLNYGTTRIAVNGDATISSMNISLMGNSLDASQFEAPIPYSLSITQESGTLTLDIKMKIMPGASLVINEGASMVVSENGSLRVEDSTPTLSNWSAYPTEDTLEALDYYGVGVLGVQGSLTVQPGGTLVGEVFALDNGKIIIEEGAQTSEATAVPLDSDALALSAAEFDSALAAAEASPVSLEDGMSYRYINNTWVVTPAGIVDLSIENFDIRAALITVNDIAGGSFNVSCTKACVVAVANADGTYTRLFYTSGSDNTYSFTVGDVFDPDIQIVVAIKGDVDGDGAATLDDALLTQKATYGPRNKNRYVASALEIFIGDIDCNGSLSLDDALLIQKSTYGPRNKNRIVLSWDNPV